MTVLINIKFALLKLKIRAIKKKLDNLKLNT